MLSYIHRVSVISTLNVGRKIRDDPEKFGIGGRLTFQEAVTYCVQQDADCLVKMAAFCGVSLNTATNWWQGSEPTGGNLVKARVFLNECGAMVDQYEVLPPEVQYLNQLMAFKVLSPEQLSELLKIKVRNDGYLWRNLLGHSLPLELKTNRLKLKFLHKQFGEALAQAKEAAALGGNTRPPAAANEPVMAVSRRTNGNGVHHTVAASFLMGLRPLLQQINAEGEESVASLRQIVGDDEFWATLEQMKAMSSRKAREIFMRNNS